jgi:alkylation response protein AidB-like acyl-CoA dehydrogenase
VTDLAERKNVSEQQARELAEESRQTEWRQPSFGKELFLGRFRLDLIHPHPRPDDDDVARGEEYLAKLEAFLREKIDPIQIERDAKIPDDVVKGLAELGTFGIKIDRKYGGLGLSQLYYNKALALFSMANPSLVALVSAHQSIGVPQPLKLAGTDEQKAEYLPRCAKGAVSAFLLTEPDVGSDPARMAATAVPDGDHYVLNGTKLWATNGTIAELYVVMARVPKSEGHRGGITAFVVESSWPGIEIARRNSFMGLRGIENGLIKFHDVRVPAANVIGDEGAGLRIALATLNTGRLSIPATCAASARWSLKMAREWGSSRVQWGQPVAKHEAMAMKVAYMAAMAFGLEAVVDLSSLLSDEGRSDIRIEAALAKLYCSEHAWQLADDLLQLRGGRGFETAESLMARRRSCGCSSPARRSTPTSRSPVTSSIRRSRPAPRPGRPPGPAASTPGGCPRSPSELARCRGRTRSSARWPNTCGTSSGTPASWPAPPSWACPAGRASSNASRASWAGWSTSARNCSR